MKFKFLIFSLPLSLATPLPTYDYIIVGSGAAGIPLATRLSASNSSVLLIERGFASSGRWNGTWKPSWLQNTNLTRFDVPALAQLVWQPDFDNHGVFCDDAPSPAGCLLGGGPAVNAGQFYLPADKDFEGQPEGWKGPSMQAAISRAERMLGWTDTPSSDGKRYLGNGSTIAIDALTNNGEYTFISANEERNRKNRTTSHAQFFFGNGEKGGPMATYLVEAVERPNFHLLMNTTVTSVLRNGGEATGVQVESNGPDGYTGSINLTPGTGRVILSAGVFGTFKILLRSGIGPVEQLSAIAAANSTALPPRDQWLDLPVGENLDDGPNLYIGFAVPGIEYYPWEKLWNSSAEENNDIKRYLEKREGPLTELQSTIGAVSWDTILGSDGIERVVQWDCTQGQNALLPGDGKYLVFGSTLTRGHTSRGSLSLSPQNLSVAIKQKPYFASNAPDDFSAVLQSATNLFTHLSPSILQLPGSFPIYPGPGQSMADYLSQAVPASSNHWVGSAKMGVCGGDDGAVVDSSTRVCGMRNLHVVDASVVNGVPSANPQGVVIAVGERGAEVILGLDGR